jgi:hypothetical protein
LPKESIKAVVINEGIQLFQVIFYLAIILHHEKTLVLPFEVRAGRGCSAFSRLIIGST